MNCASELTIAADKQVRVAHLLAAEWRVGQASEVARKRGDTRT